MFNTQHLITFHVLVETGSFTQTAKQLGLTQPAVTQHIQKLESILGEPLLARRGRKTEITSAGNVLLNHVKALEQCYGDFDIAWHDYLMMKNAGIAQNLSKLDGLEKTFDKARH